MNKKELYPIKFVENRTGLTGHVIRAWEKRYSSVIPERSTSNRRLYSDEDIEKLILLKSLTDKGHSISQISSYSIKELRNLTNKDKVFTIVNNKSKTKKESKKILEECFLAVNDLDLEKLKDLLSSSSITMSNKNIIDKLVYPLITYIGEEWHKGSLRVSNEHAATAIIRTFLGELINNFKHSINSPRIIIATPVNQVHELGALICAYIAASLDWEVIYLGADLPTEDIIDIAIKRDVDVIALSVVYPEDDIRLVKEFMKLRKFLPDIPIVVGGRASLSYSNILEQIKAYIIKDSNDFSNIIKKVRSEKVNLSMENES